MDAVDVALVELGTALPELIATSTRHWPNTLQQRLRALAAGAPIDATALAILDAEVGEFLGSTIAEMLAVEAIDPQRVSAIGCHGQTVAHVPDADFAATLQIGDANVIAERTGITTVNDFRRRDIAAGGQGAPLTPAFHEAFLRDSGEDRVVLNLGGIANITVLPSAADRPATGFDTGPANCLMDLWTRQQLGRAYDEDGAWAETAQPHSGLLAALLDDAYFGQQPPKSTGTQYFSAPWLRERLAATPPLTPAQVQATLMAFTCRTVTDAIHGHAPDTRRVLVCGGGVHNRALVRQLADMLGIPVGSTGDFGLSPDWVEAMAFAWLAQRAISGHAGNLPAVTGARGPRILGAIHPA